MKLTILILLSLFSISCNSQKVKNFEKNEAIKEKGRQIGEYVIDAFEDSKGHLWFGTLQKGIARYDGNELRYFTKKDGLPSNRVTGVIERPNGEYWFETDQGISKYDGSNFTNLKVSDDFYSNLTGSLFFDSKGTCWLSTWGGVFIFDGEKCTPFPLPYPEVSTSINKDTQNWITAIVEDPEGNIWFGRDGYGACKYDGKTFTHFLKKDGLHSNNITEIEIDQKGNIWFGTRVAERDNPDPSKRIGKGGVNQLINNNIISFPEIDAFNNNDVHQIYEDPTGNIWIGTRNDGVYKYNGETFQHYDIPISITGMLRDSKGNLWLAGAGGLYQINPDEVIENVTMDGPWE